MKYQTSKTQAYIVNAYIVQIEIKAKIGNFICIYKRKVFFFFLRALYWNKEDYFYKCAQNMFQKASKKKWVPNKLRRQETYLERVEYNLLQSCFQASSLWFVWMYAESTNKYFLMELIKVKNQFLDQEKISYWNVHFRQQLSYILTPILA